MSSWARTRKVVYKRADGYCEYCYSADANTGQSMQVDHIYPDGGNELDNLCLACWNCNTTKLDIISVIDPLTNNYAALYNPRTQNWLDHFQWISGGTHIAGITANGRATIQRLQMNRPTLVVARQRWILSGYHPPKWLLTTS